MSFEHHAVVRVPFPFTDRAATRNRPAPILSDATGFNAPASHSVLAMNTSADNPPWPHDHLIADLAAAGLPVPSRLRFKRFTLDNRLIRGTPGRRAPADARAVRAALKRVLDV